MRSGALLLAAAGVLCAGSPSIFYSKAFPGSSPEFVSVEVQRDGTAVYRESPADDDPVQFKLSEADTNGIFQLADKLDRFKRPLESNLKVANMGKKVFRYQDGGERHEVSFNYSLDETARQLQDFFEKITETQQLLFFLERSVRFDKLGVNKSLLQVEAAWDRKRLVGPERFLPMLDRVVKNDSYLHMARERAAALADIIRNPKPEKGGQQ